MNLPLPILAPFKGFQLCLTDPELRRLAIRPWSIGAVACCLSLGVGIYLLPGEGFWQILGSIALLLVGTLVVTLAAVLILGSYYHSRIAYTLLARASMAKEELTLVREVGRTTVTELLKLLWLTPLYLILFIGGLIPIFTIPAFLLGSILLSYQFFDFPLDHLHYGAFSRLGYVLRHAVTAILFGGTLIVLGAIPFMALLIAPAAVAGASWLIVESREGLSDSP